MSTETPRTDAEEYDTGLRDHPGADKDMVVSANLARTLERDLTAAREQIAALTAERDAARERGVELEAGLRKAEIALPVLQVVLKAARLAGDDVAAQMLDEIRALLSPSPEPKP